MYLYWFLMANASVIIPLFIKGIYLLLLCLVIMGIGIGMALPCLDALITQGIEKEQRGTVTSFYSSMRFIGVAMHHLYILFHERAP